MIGLIQHIFQVAISEQFGDEVKAQIFVEAGLPSDFDFRMDKDYSNEEWHRLLAATKSVLKLSDDDIDKFYAQHFYLKSKALFPTWFTMSKNSYEFISRQPAIHNSLASGVIDSTDSAIRKGVNDKFRIEQLDNHLVTHYNSPNKHCGLYKALAHEIAKHYGETIRIEETKCLHNKDSECEIHLYWE